MSTFASAFVNCHFKVAGERGQEGEQTDSSKSLRCHPYLIYRAIMLNLK